MKAAAGAKQPAARDGAKKFLQEFLADGPRLRSEIDEAAEANGIANRTLIRAKDDLKVIVRKDGPDGSWTWRLPDD
jgi:putative DNA primase/helicase